MERRNIHNPHPDGEHESGEAPPVPDHLLLRRIGSGSYGDVWLARSELGAFRAVKIVYRRSFDSERPFEREFEGIRKFEPISRTHEGQVDVLQVGRRDDYFYYVMELADDLNTSGSSRMINDPGRYVPCTLEALIENTPRLPFAECLRIGLGLGRALQHLHQSGLVHRDIKPANIIFVNGSPKLADIGLVTDADGTRTFVGTEGFLSPEGTGTPQADLYALGKVLYEVSTGLDRREFPTMAPEFGNLPDRHKLLEFVEVIEKACAPDPACRYPSASALCLDLELLGAGQSVRKRHRRQRWGRRVWRGLRWLGIVLLAAWLILQMVTDKRPVSKHRTATLSSSDADAIRSYEMGLFHITKRTWAAYLDASIELERAIEIDPGFAEAQMALAEVLSLQAQYTESLPEPYWRLAKQRAERALELKPDLLGAQIVLAQYETYFRCDLLAAESYCRQVLELDADHTDARTLLSQILAYRGRFDESIEQAQRVAELNPTSALRRSQVAMRLVYAGRFDEALNEFDAAIRLQPNFHVPLEEKGFLQLHLGRDGEALNQLSKAWLLSGNPEAGTRQRYAALSTGSEAFWKFLFNSRLASREAGQPGDPADMARYLVKLGRLDEAMGWAEVALEEHRNVFDLLNHAYYIDFQRHPGFDAFAARVRHPIQ